MRTKYSALSCLVGLAFAANAAAAFAEGSSYGGTQLYAPGDRPSSAELASILFGGGDPAPVAAPRPAATRGIVMTQAAVIGAAGDALPQVQSAPSPASAAAPVAVQTAPIQAAEAQPVAAEEPKRSVSFHIEFGFDSVALPHASDGQLEALASALKSDKAQGKTVVIIGHTDTVGSAAYNRKLSLRRAAATREVLIVRYGVPGSRLLAVGRGMDAPLPGLPGAAAQNRRVEFQTLG